MYTLFYKYIKVKFPFYFKIPGGVQLSKEVTRSDLFVSGSMDVDNIQATHLTLLIPLATLETEVPYVCDITVFTNSGLAKTLQREFTLTEDGR